MPVEYRESLESMRDCATSKEVIGDETGTSSDFEDLGTSVILLFELACDVRVTCSVARLGEDCKVRPGKWVIRRHYQGHCAIGVVIAASAWRTQSESGVV